VKSFYGKIYQYSFANKLAAGLLITGSLAGCGATEFKSDFYAIDDTNKLVEYIVGGQSVLVKFNSDFGVNSVTYVTEVELDDGVGEVQTLSFDRIGNNIFGQAILSPASSGEYDVTFKYTKNDVLDEAVVHTELKVAIPYNTVAPATGLSPNYDLGLFYDVPENSDASLRYPAIIYAHGGYYFSRNLLDFESEIQYAAEHGYVGVTIDYRLTQDATDPRHESHKWPAQLNDVQCAIQWVRANADELQVDPNKIAVYGYSSGGHLALMAGLSSTEVAVAYNSNCPNKDESISVQAVVAVSITSDLTDPDEVTGDLNRNAAKTYNHLYGENPTMEEMKAASPIYKAESIGVNNVPPMLVFHGSTDEVVKFNSFVKLRSVFAAATTDTNHFVELVGAGHTWSASAIDFQREQAFLFLDHYLKDKSENTDCLKWSAVCQLQEVK